MNQQFSTFSRSSYVAVTSSDGVVGIPIDFDVASRIEGNKSQVSKLPWNVHAYQHKKVIVKLRY